MPDLWAGLAEVGLTPLQLVVLVLAGTVAGLVRGFAGFGTAMVYLPIAGQILPPIWALVTLVIMDFFGPIPNLPRGWRDADRPDLVRLITGMVATLPVGVALLAVLEPEVIRYVISVLALVLTVLLVSGFRYRGPMTRPLVIGTGAVGGITGGVAGIPGPPVILLYMASGKPAQVVRANNLVYLFVFDIFFMGLVAWRGWMELVPVVLGLVVVLPNLLGNMAGAAMFRPERERVYRWAAYGMIAASALSGLPLWD
ncbi:sulfite exporter TauE/SafE family protein [Mesobacterium pallidum]|uniref:sulfite exporter TauE/SafE family protein n=1 Tax=Mesobacterium pallidum TaxID=2872037 RepID=UPI001EE19720|nr:sulfite exporter TauE/SafE family protein [Mesobacterium pallidum]